MIAIETTMLGGVDALVAGTRPVPALQPGEVLIKVVAAGVNRPDIMQRTGSYPAPPGANDVLGLEVAGTIADIGIGVGEWRVGDAICALVNGGGYAEFCVTPAGCCLPIPKNLNFIEASSLPETFFTVWVNVFDRANLKQGETILVQGGSSGIGVAAIQMAHALGSRVFATAGTEEKCRACEALGAERAIHYPSEDFVKIVMEQTSGHGADVILDMVGGDYVPREFEAMAEDGRLVMIQYMHGADVSVNIKRLMQRRLTLTGSTLRPRSLQYKAAVAGALRTKIWPLILDGRIKPVIFDTFPLVEATSAHKLMESGRHIGKIVLVVDEAASLKTPSDR